MTLFNPAELNNTDKNYPNQKNTLKNSVVLNYIIKNRPFTLIAKVHRIRLSSYYNQAFLRYTEVYVLKKFRT